MRCPDCRLDLVILEVDGVELDFCLDHHGVWFDHDELLQLFARADAPQELLELEARLMEPAAATQARRASANRSKGGKRRCPRCAIRLQEVMLGRGPIIDSCPRGHGLWFDPGEVQQLAQAALDVHSPGFLRVQGYLDHFFHPVVPKS
jgi:uncharacterized protein